MSLVISMRSFCFSNSMRIFCMLGRFMRLFITRIAWMYHAGQQRQQEVQAVHRLCTAMWSTEGMTRRAG
jgi:hypothetical protein